MEELRRNEINLLTIPRSDVGLPMPKENNDKTNYPSLLLLQLPPRVNAEDLKDVRFVIPQPQQQASLIIENCDTSFQLQRVETSNSLVLVPPPSNKNSTVDDDDDDDHDDNNNANRKRRKLTEKGECLQVVQARVLHQGSGAFFLEGRQVPLRLTQLADALPVWDPYHNQSTGHAKTVSLTTLGDSLAKSRNEVLAALRRLEAVEYQRQGFCRLAEEVRLDVLDAVLATLVEAFSHCFGTQDTTISVPDVLSSCRGRLPKKLKADAKLSSILIRHCVGTLVSSADPPTIDWNDNNSSTDSIQLDVGLVGAAVASRVLTRQTVWEESLFMARWQAEMPGVNVQVSPLWLKGHAVRVMETTLNTTTEAETELGENSTTTTTTYYWKYLPCPMVVADAPDAKTVWQRLLDAKPEWTMSELEPYLEAYELYSGQSSVTVLSNAAMRKEGDLKIYHGA